MQAGDVVLSDVHVGCGVSNGKELSKTIFYLKSEENAVEFDEDGDFVVKRLQESVEIVHSLATTLPDVGQQLWLGALVMCDYVLENPSLFQDKNVLELGCGIGLTAIFLSRVCQHITCADYNKKALEICLLNLKENCVKNTNVKTFDFYTAADDIASASLDYPNIIVACEIVYSNDLTEAFFNTIFIICTRPELFKTPQPKGLQIFLSLEKRINFTFPELKETCKEYDYFQEKINELETKLNEINMKFIVNKLDVNSLKQRLVYERVPQLELWTIFIDFQHNGE